jgi:hypothetical protein
LIWINVSNTASAVADWIALASKLPLAAPYVIGWRIVRYLPCERFVASCERQECCLRFSRGGSQRHLAQLPSHCV